MKRVIISILFILWAGFAWAAPRVNINDILSNPSPYYNTMVEIEESLMNVTSGTTSIASGPYTFIDDLNRQIEVRTHKLFAIDKHFVIKGVVSQDSAIPVMLLVVMLLFVVTLALIVALLVIIFLPSRAAETLQPPPLPRVAKPGRVPTTKYEGRRQPTVAFLDGMASLTIIEGPADVKKVYPITQKESIIGREGDIKLSEAHQAVSNEHARLTYEGEGKFTLTHLSRTNTTKVNDQNITQSRSLQSEDEIQLGVTKLRFEVQS